VSSQTGRINATKKGVSGDSDESRAGRTALSMSSGSYSGLTIHEPIQRYLKESVIAPKTLSSGKAEQYEIPPDLEQFRGLLKSSVSEMNVRSRVC
jgi:hypothetical protein